MAKITFINEKCFYVPFGLIGTNFGYACAYLEQNWNTASLQNTAKLNVYKTLYEIDSQIGISSEYQLWYCCHRAVNLNIIKVIDINRVYHVENGPILNPLKPWLDKYQLL